MKFANFYQIISKTCDVTISLVSLYFACRIFSGAPCYINSIPSIDARKFEAIIFFRYENFVYFDIVALLLISTWKWFQNQNRSKCLLLKLVMTILAFLVVSSLPHFPVLVQLNPSFLPKPKWDICLIFKIKQKVSNELSSILRSNIRSADWISISRSNYYLEIQNSICRSNIKFWDSNSIYRSNIRS